jgi:diphthine-ammonia ligase
VDELQPLLCSLAARYGCQPAGEGGEYETLVVDCAAFGEASLQLTDTRVVTGRGEEGHLLVVAAALLPKGDATVPAAVVAEDNRPQPPPPPSPPPRAPRRADELPTVACVRGARGCTLSARLPAAAACAGDALDAALEALSCAMAEQSLRWADALTVHLCLPDMACFAACNAAYARRVPHSAPPARACVQHALSDVLAIDVIVMQPCAALQRRAMHVQSISGWAPACIGPYAQAVQAGRLLFLAGCLGLEPATMRLPACTHEQARRALAAADAASRACGAGALAACALALTVFVTCSAGARAAEAAWADMREGRSPPPPEYADDEPAEEGHPRAGEGGYRPLMLTVTQPALPRGAAVEVQPLAAARRRGAARSGGAADGAAWLSGCVLRALVPFAADGAHGTCGAEAAAAEHRLSQQLQEAGLSWDDVLCLRLYAAPACGEPLCAALACALPAAPVSVAVCALALSGESVPPRAVLELTAWREEEDQCVS